MKLKTLFLGSSHYCLSILETLSQDTNLLCVITHPDKKIGKEQSLTPSITKQFAIKNNIPILTPGDKEELLNLKSKIISLQPDIAIVADYGLLIPREIFEIPKYKTLNIHFSQLPKYRGASPVQYTILYGEKSAWITVQILAEKLDAGYIIWQKEILLTGTETTGELYPKLFEIASENIIEVIANYMKGTLKLVKQNESQATHTRRLTRDDGFIPFTVLKAAIQGLGKIGLNENEWPDNSVLFETLSHCNIVTFSLEAAIRAFTPWPGIWTEIELSNQLINQSTNKPIKMRLKILKAHIKPITHHPPASPQGGSPTTKLIPDIVQMEGKKPVSWKQFLEGYPKLLI